MSVRTYVEFMIDRVGVTRGDEGDIYRTSLRLFVTSSSASIQTLFRCILRFILARFSERPAKGLLD